MTSLLQALGDAGIDAPLWCATRGAVSVNRADDVDHPTQAMAWGLGRIAAFEYPQRWGGLIDLPGEWDDRAGRRLVALLAQGPGEDQVALRGSGVFTRRMVRALPEDRPAGDGWRPHGTVLVTGGRARWAGTSPAGWPATVRSISYSSAVGAPRRPVLPRSSRSWRGSERGRPYGRVMSATGPR